MEKGKEERRCRRKIAGEREREEEERNEEGEGEEGN